jgi:glutamate-1-semialdehyde 2,1-aminomutase|eukprot:COSAG06_NODE_8557_length_2130_cov_2.443624_2_plen_101_part_00
MSVLIRLVARCARCIRLFAPVPMYVTRGEGCRKWDADGHEYIDFLCGNGALLLGHAHPAVVEAVVAAASLGTHFGSDSPLTIEWAEKIQARKRVFLRRLI